MKRRNGKPLTRSGTFQNVRTAVTTHIPDGVLTSAPLANVTMPLDPALHLVEGVVEGVVVGALPPTMVKPPLLFEDVEGKDLREEGKGVVAVADTRAVVTLGAYNTHPHLKTTSSFFLPLCNKHNINLHSKLLWFRGRVRRKKPKQPSQVKP
jgi:hypothetical protein